MTEEAIKTHVDFVLPPSVVSKLDVAHMVEELEAIDNALTTASVRKTTGVQVEEGNPSLSSQLSDFLEKNRLVIGSAQERSRVVKELRMLKDTIPVVHMTFAVKADQTSLQQIVQWLRESVHSQAVVSVGLQPALVAGVYLRTPNKVHDMSLRAKLDGSHDVLIKELETLRAGR